jgi:hypothetical protein
MNKLSVLIVHAVILVIAAAVGLAAQGGERLSDKDVVKIFEAVDHGRDRFEEQLDGKVKRSIVRGPRGEVNVEQYLEDLQKNVENLRQRFTARYAASNEAATVLKQASDIDRAIKAQPKELKGGSEWDRLAIDLSRLAEAYGTEFPLPPDAPVRRINDEEAAAAAEMVAKEADRLKQAIGKDKTFAKADRDGIRSDLDQLKKDAGVVKSRTGSGKPATAEARQVKETTARVAGALSGRTLSSDAQDSWVKIQSSMSKIDQAYRLTPRAGSS